MTALWISCEMKNSALVELLVEAGANLKTVDSEERTAIIIAASSSAEAVVPTEELSPNIFKVLITFLLYNRAIFKVIFTDPFFI